MEIKFGKHKGKTFDRVPKSYQLWLLKNNLVHIECAEWFFEKFLDEQLVKIRKDRQKTFHVFTTASILSAIPNTKLNLHTNSTFVRVDDDGAPTPIDNSIRDNFK